MVKTTPELIDNKVPVTVKIPFANAGQVRVAPKVVTPGPASVLAKTVAGWLGVTTNWAFELFKKVKKLTNAKNIFFNGTGFLLFI